MIPLPPPPPPDGPGIEVGDFFLPEDINSLLPPTVSIPIMTCALLLYFLIAVISFCILSGMIYPLIVKVNVDFAILFELSEISIGVSNELIVA